MESPAHQHPQDAGWAAPQQSATQAFDTQQRYAPEPTGSAPAAPGSFAPQPPAPGSAAWQQAAPGQAPRSDGGQQPPLGLIGGPFNPGALASIPASVLLLIGGLGPWVTTSAFGEVSGSSGDGVIVAVLAVVAIAAAVVMVLRATARLAWRRHLGWVIAAAGLISAAVGFYDATRVQHLFDQYGSFGMRLGWGVTVVRVFALVVTALGIAAAVLGRRAGVRQEAAAGQPGGWNGPAPVPSQYGAPHGMDSSAAGSQWQQPSTQQPWAQQPSPQQPWTEQSSTQQSSTQQASGWEAPRA